MRILLPIMSESSRFVSFLSKQGKKRQNPVVMLAVVSNA